MANLPIFDEAPILQAQKVSSGAEGMDNVARLFGEVTKVGVGIVGNNLEAESKAHLYQANRQAQQIKQDYELSLKANPDPIAGQIALRTMNESLGELSKNAYVNRSDRGLLQKQIDQDLLASEKDLGLLTIDQANKAEQMLFAEGFPDQLNMIAGNLFGNPELAQQQITGVQDLMKGMFQRGTIPLKTYERYSSIIEKNVDRVSAIVNRGSELDLTAEDFHKIVPFIGAKDVPGGAPINVATRATYAHLKTETNFGDTIAQLYKGQPNYANVAFAVSEMSDDQFFKFLETADGVSQAKAYINAGHAYGGIEERVNYLNHRKGATLTEKESAERDMLSLFLTNMNDDYLGTMQGTPQGQQISSSYMAELNRVRESYTNDPLRMQQEEIRATNEYRADLINYGRAIGVPSNVIKPFDAATVASAQGAFNNGADPVLAISTLKTLSPVNAAYLASSMEKPNQQQAMMIVSALPNDKTGASQRMIYANQKGMDYSALNFEKGNITKAKLNAKVATKLEPVLGYLGKQQRSGDSSTGVYDATLNYVKYLAVTNGDLQLENVDNYINEAVQTVGKAYRIENGNFYSFNTSRQPIASADAHALAGYVREEAWKQMGKGLSAEKLALAGDLNPLFVTMDESGMVNAVDTQGVIVWQQPYTETLLDAARGDARRIDRLVADKKRKFNESRISTTGGLFMNELNSGEGDV
jgi:hypothetical protein